MPNAPNEWGIMTHSPLELARPMVCGSAVKTLKRFPKFGILETSMGASVRPLASNCGVVPEV